MKNTRIWGVLGLLWSLNHPYLAQADTLTINSPHLSPTPLVELLERPGRVETLHQRFTDIELYQLQKITGYLDRHNLNKIYLTPPFNADNQENSWISLAHQPRFEALTKIYKAVMDVADQNDQLMKALMSQKIDDVLAGNQEIDLNQAADDIDSALSADVLGKQRITMMLAAMLPLIGYSSEASIDDTKLSDYLSIVFDRSVVAVIADIVFGYSVEEMKLIKKVLLEFPEIEIARMKVDEVFTIAALHDGTLSTRVSDEGSEADQDFYTNHMFTNKLDRNFLRGLENLHLTTSGGNIQIDLPFSTTLAVGILPDSASPFVLKFPGVFQQAKKVQLGLSGILKCRFMGEIRDNYVFSLTKKPGKIIDDQSYRQGKPVNDISIAACQLFDESGRAISDQNGRIDPALLPADVAANNPAEAVSRLEMTISDRSEKFIEKYTNKFKSALSTKEALLKEALKRQTGWENLPVPVSKEVKQQWAVMNECHEKNVGARCVREVKKWDALKFKHKTHCAEYESVFETVCHPYFDLVNKVVKKEVTTFYIDEFAFEQLFDVEDKYEFNDTQSFSVRLLAANDICIANSGRSGGQLNGTACAAREQMDDEFIEQQDKVPAFASSADEPEFSEWDNGLFLPEFE